MARLKQLHCKHGHLISEVGRSKDGACNACSRLRAKTYREANPEKALAKTKKWKRDHPERIRDGRRKQQYHITPEQYNQRLEEQQHKCKVCGVKLSNEQKLTTPCLDHSHACCPPKKSCGKCIRGILCYACNTVLGFAKDNIQMLENAIQYLKETQCKNKLNT